jgi:hypothetical protein
MISPFPKLRTCRNLVKISEGILERNNRFLSNKTEQKKEVQKYLQDLD